MADIDDSPHQTGVTVDASNTIMTDTSNIITKYDDVDASRATSGERDTATSYSDLPAELRNNIYDLVAEDHRPENLSDCKLMPLHFIYSRYVRSFCSTPALGQVSREIRQEYLARHHNMYGINVNLDDMYHVCIEWLQVFGATRVPLTHHFKFWYEDCCCEILLKGGNTFTEGKRFKVIQPYLEPSEEISGRELADFFYHSPQSSFEAFVEGLIHEKDGIVFLTMRDIEKIFAYLMDCPMKAEERELAWFSG